MLLSSVQKVEVRSIDRCHRSPNGERHGMVR